MAISSRIRVMISSRCNALFPAKTGRKMSDIRRDLKQRIESVTLFEEPLFEVWINEDEPPQGLSWDIWDVCLQAVQDCDILLVLYNGEAGWAQHEEDIGICHAELQEALAYAAAKIRAIDLGETTGEDGTPVSGVNARFREYWSQHSIFTGQKVATEAELFEQADHALFNAVLKLTQAGVQDAGRGRFHSGAALDWSRLNFDQRANAMKAVVRNAIKGRNGSVIESEVLFSRLLGKKILTVCHAIPAPLSVGAAREMVGQPFLHDHEYAGYLNAEQVGPVHIIACHKNATEAQAIKMLGFPDATVVHAPFGIYVADPIQKVQFMFLTNCRDDASTRQATKRLFDWLDQTGEVNLFVKRAEARARIVQVIANESGPV